MPLDLATAYVSIVPSAKGFAKGLSDEIDSPLEEGGRRSGEKASKTFGDSFGNGLKTAAKVGAAALAVGFAGAVKIGADSVKAASDLGESINAVNVVFEQSAKGVLAIGDNSAKSLGLSKSEFNSLAVQFSSFAGKIAGPGADVTDTIKSITSRAADFASVMNLDVTDAATIFQSGLSGETEPLKKYGLDLSAVAVSAYGAAHGIGAQGKEMTETEKVQARYGLLMELTAKTQGDFANTSDGLANRQRILKASFENSKAAIGNGLLPIMAAIMPIAQKVAEFLGNNLPGAVTKVTAVIQDNLPTIKKIASDVFDAIAASVGFIVRDVLPPLSTAFQATFGFLMDNKEVLIGVAAALGVAITQLFIGWTIAAGSAAIATITAIAPFIAAAAAIGLLVAGVLYAYNHFQLFHDVVNSVKDFIVDHLIPAFADIWGFINDKIVPIIKTLVEVYIASLIFQFNVVKDVITGVVIPAFQAVFNFITNTLIPIFVSIATTVANVAVDVGSAVGSIVKFVTDIPSRVGGFVREVRDKFSEAFNGAKDEVGNIVNRMLDIVTGIPGRVADVFLRVFDVITSPFKRAFNFVIDIFNATLGKLKFTIPDWVPGGIGGETWGIAPLPHFHSGGMVEGVGDVQAVLRGGEMVLTGPQQAALFNMANGMGSAGNDQAPLIGVLNNNRQDLGVAELNQVFAMARLAR